MDRCSKLDEREWSVVWDDIAVEHRLMSLDARRIPDVLLLSKGAPTAAIEVYATHLVDKEKAQVLADLSLPWVEVVAAEILPPPRAAEPGSHDLADLIEKHQWLAPAPLPIFREGSGRPWRCAEHQARYDAWHEQQRLIRLEWKRQDAEDAERARHTVRLKALRIVDVMYPTGKHYRNLYRVEEQLTDGKPHSIALSLHDRTICSVRLGSRPKPELWQRLQEECNRHIAMVGARSTAIDSPMTPGSEWIKGTLVQKVWQRVVTTTKWRFGYPLADYYPMRYRRNGTTGEWFLLPDLRDVTWDRGEDDSLSPHLASARTPPRRETRRTQATPPVQTPVGRIIGPFTFGDRLTALDLEVSVDEIIVNPGFRVFVVRPAGGPQVAVAFPCGKANEVQVREADEILRDNRFIRLWVSPPGDWSRRISAVPWCGVRRHESRRLMVPKRTGFISLADLIRALASSDVTPEHVLAWDERSRLDY